MEQVQTDKVPLRGEASGHANRKRIAMLAHHAQDKTAACAEEEEWDVEEDKIHKISNSNY